MLQPTNYETDYNSKTVTSSTTSALNLSDGQ